MSQPDPHAEWRARWQSGLAGIPIPGSYQQPPRRPRSPWVYAAAAFGGTVAAIIFCIVAAIGALIAIGIHLNGFDQTPNSLTYRNDTEELVNVYQCADRCTEESWAFGMDPGDEYSLRLEWYEDEPVEWVVVTREDATYSCIYLRDWADQTIAISQAGDCPADIHSPENQVS